MCNPCYLWYNVPMVINKNEIKYVASRTTRDFHKSDKFVRALMGPIGSGKSVACIFEMFLKSLAQKPNDQGVRKTRWVIVRNTYRELIDTTIQSFFDWIPESIGHMMQKDMKFTINNPHPSGDGTQLYVEFMFRALDRPNDVKKLLSLEMTGMFVNEAREIPKAIIDMGIGRLGRYPNKRDGGPTWHGLIMDTNPPDSDHWWYSLFEDNNCPHNHALFKQPAGDGPDAENVDNLPPGYYENMKAGKDKEWQNVYIKGLYGFIADGKPVWPAYNDDIHHTDEDLPLAGNGTIYVGIDFGLTPAAVIGQITASGQMQIIDELVTFDMGAVQFGKLLHEKLNNKYCGCQLEIYGDPAGEQRSQSDESTPFMMLSHQGIEAWPTYTNDPLIRIEAVTDYLTRLDFTGKPAFVIGPKATMLRKALAGGYKYRRMQVTGEERYMDKPDKGRYSHCFVADTPISTPTGTTPIQELIVGDKVNTPFGEYPVTAIMSREVPLTVNVTSGDITLRCTPDHLFYTEDGIVRADALQYSILLKENTVCKHSMTSRFMTSLKGILRQTISSTAKPSTCTDMCGNTTTGLSLKGMLSTIKTTINQTIASTISSVSPQVSMPVTTLNYGATQVSLNLPQNSHLIGLQNGTGALKGLSGIKRMVRGHGKTGSQTRISANTVTKSTQHFVELSRKVTARHHAKVGQDESVELMTKQEHASYAKQISELISTRKLDSVESPVQVSSIEQTVRVYDITVGGVHMFYANGVLTQNCADALQYLFLGSVGGDRVMGGFDKKPIDYSKTNQMIV